MYYDILTKAYPHIHDILNTKIQKARSDMKEMDPSVVGSWKKAVTSGDGVYHTRGYHSKNMTVLVVDYKKNALIAAVHLCMRGEDSSTSDISLFEGTAKAAEGYGFELIWHELKGKGFEAHVHWQDGDSSSERSFERFQNKVTHLVLLIFVHRTMGLSLDCTNEMVQNARDYKVVAPLGKRCWSLAFQLFDLCDNGSILELDEDKATRYP
uniref:Uncharacterized protein n=1 Tax=Branchiostoma floridae TaxID=7739 RepID=C3Y8P6_BRAFL|eukprot:XP_002607473.1 hypothetical protein BRAFLDRAFT_69905 [Branchiostoma floridae]